MRYVRCMVILACTVVLGACTTGPYKESINTLAKGISASQSALTKLSERDIEIRRRQQLRSQKQLRIGTCEIGSSCDFVGIARPKTQIPNALLYMAQLVAYANALAELAEAKDTDAIQKAAGKIDAAAQSGVKAFGSQIAQSATINAGMDIVGLIANEIIEAQRVAALKDAILRNRFRIANAITVLGNASHQLQQIVVDRELGYLNQQLADFNRSTDPGERQRLSSEISAEQASLSEIAKTDARVPFRALLRAHQAVIRAIQRPDLPFEDAVGAVLDFLEKAQALDVAVKKEL